MWRNGDPYRLEDFPRVTQLVKLKPKFKSGLLALNSTLSLIFSTASGLSIEERNTLTPLSSHQTLLFLQDVVQGFLLLWCFSLSPYRGCPSVPSFFSSFLWLHSHPCPQEGLGSITNLLGGLDEPLLSPFEPWFFSHLLNGTKKYLPQGLGEICTNLSQVLSGALTTLYYNHLFKCLSPSRDWRAGTDSDLSLCL